MFAMLIESCPEQREGFGWTGKALSFMAHVVLVSAAVAATRQAAAAVTGPAFIDTTVTWVNPHPPVTAPVGQAPPWVAPTTIPVGIPQPGPIPVDVPQIGDPDPGVPPGLTTDPHPGLPGLFPGGTVVSPGVPIDARLVDVPPELIWHPELRYPEVMRQAGIEGRVMVEAVLDTLGRAEPASLRVALSPNVIFDREAVAVVQGSRYRPARVDGRAVRVRVQVPVTFQIRR